MYALNTIKGTTINNPDVGLLEAGVAVLIPDEAINVAKNLRGVVLFDKIAGLNESKISKSLYGKDIAELKEKIEKEEEKIEYKDFVKKYKDVKVAGEKWDEYKKEKGIS